MRGLFWGSVGGTSQPTETNGGVGAKPLAAGDTGAEPQALKNFAFFCKNNFNTLKRGIEIGSANMIKLVA